MRGVGKKEYGTRSVLISLSSGWMHHNATFIIIVSYVNLINGGKSTNNPLLVKMGNWFEFSVTAVNTFIIVMSYTNCASFVINKMFLK